MEDYKTVLEIVKKLPERVSKTRPYSRASYWKEHWNKDYYLQYAIDTGRPYQQIVAKFLQLKGTPIDNYQQVNFFFRRNEKLASELVGFPLEQIEKVYKYCETKMDSYRIALNTVGKYLEEDIDVLRANDKGEDPIITLNNGEKIYDINRLCELERQGKVYYKDEKWHEVK